MNPSGKKLRVFAPLILITAAILLWLFSGDPYYQGRPVGQWAIDYSRKLYPSGTAPISPSQRGLNALREMGPQKAATALVHALTYNDSRLYEWYRGFHSKLPAWYQARFPLRLTYRQRVGLILGATEFFDEDYQKAMIPFIIAYLDGPNAANQVAACQLLAAMPATASPALSSLQRLTDSVEISVSQAAQTAVNCILSTNSIRADSQPSGGK